MDGSVDGPTPETGVLDGAVEDAAPADVAADAAADVVAADAAADVAAADAAADVVAADAAADVAAADAAADVAAADAAADVAVVDATADVTTVDATADVVAADASVDGPSPGTPGAVCVDDVLAAFNALKHHHEAMGFHLGTAPDPTGGHHWQGIQRSAELGAPYLFVTRSGAALPGQYGNLVTVKMASRGQDGERMRSNRLQPVLATEATMPPPGDVVVNSMPFTDYGHIGAFQMVGGVLAVPLENPAQPTDPDGKVVLIDVADPLAPKRLSYEIEFPSHAAGAVGITKLASGKFLLVVGGIDKGRKLEFYLSSGNDLRAANLSFSLLDEWDHSELVGGSWPLDFPTVLDATYQSLNFVTDCNGDLYLMTSRNTLSSGAGFDMIGLYSVTDYGAGQQITLTQVTPPAQRYCDAMLAGKNCSFAAAAGVYVSPSGELIYYALEHDNDGPGATIKMAEFRHRDVNRAGACTVAWAELYDDDDFSDRSVVFDWPDRSLDDFNDFNKLDGFNDKASSVRYCAPAGCQIRLYEHDSHGGSSHALTGNGSVKSIADLDTIGWGDKTSSVQFFATSPGACGP